jgi:hypothetical protein
MGLISFRHKHNKSNATKIKSMDEAKIEAIKFLEEEKNDVAKVGDKVEFKLEDIPTPVETVENLLKDMADNAEKLDEEIKEVKEEPKPKRKRSKKVK